MFKKGLLFSVVLKTCVLYAQQLDPSVMCSAGGTLSNGSTLLNWTIGETVTATFGPNNQLSSGYSQANYTVTALTNNLSLQAIKIFPNPAGDILSIKVNQGSFTRPCYELYNTTGSVINEGMLQNERTDVNCSQLAPATYWLKISDLNHEILETFKIVKL